jgi:hypothetical protein
MKGTWLWLYTQGCKAVYTKVVLLRLLTTRDSFMAGVALLVVDAASAQAAVSAAGAIACQLCVVIVCDYASVAAAFAVCDV